MIRAEMTPDAKPYERVLARINAERLDGIKPSVDKLATLWNAWTCPPNELPKLAWALSVDFWDANWPVHRQRQVVAEALTFHRRKTTPAGARMALSYRDADLVNYNLPRDGFFVDKAVSSAEEKIWIDGLPEIRIYDPAPVVRAGPVRRFAAFNLFARGDARLSRKAVLRQGDAETALTIRPSGLMEKITFPAQKRSMMIAARGARLRLAGPSVLKERVLAIHPVTSDAAYVRSVASSGDDGTFISSSKHLKSGVKAVFTPVRKGGLRIAAPVAITQGYLSLKYSAQSGRLTGHRPLNVVGKSRVARKAFTAAWRVGWSRQIPRSRIAQGRLVAARSEPLVQGFMEAIKSAAALRDTDFISLNATRRLTFADLRNLKAGTKFGDRRSNRNV